MDSVRRSQSSDVLTEAEEVSGFLLELAHFFREWRFTLPDVLILLQVFFFVTLSVLFRFRVSVTCNDVTKKFPKICSCVCKFL